MYHIPPPKASEKLRRAKTTPLFQIFRVGSLGAVRVVCMVLPVSAWIEPIGDVAGETHRGQRPYEFTSFHAAHCITNRAGNASALCRVKRQVRLLDATTTPT